MRTILCNDCYKKLSKKELEVYSLQWQYSGDMYCMKCRVCPDDCRQDTCPLLNTEEQAKAGTNKQTTYYKVLGKVQESGKDAYYRLCYTSDKQAALTHYKRNGWKKEQIIFEAMQAK
jgi:hypothetical protein